MTEICLGLRNFVGVMRKSVIYAAAMKVKIFAEVLYAYRGAFYMPAGIADASRGVPLQFLILKL